MLKKFIFLSLFFFVSCGPTIDKEQLALLNGYWEIKEVTFSDGTKKEYRINSTVDYIKLDSLQGFRKKVSPKFNGTFETSNDAEPLQIRIVKDFIFIEYKTPLTSWKETLLSLSENDFSVKNDQGIIYSYKRFEPINITP